VLTFSRLDVDRLKACETKYFIARMLGLDEPRELTRDVDAALVGMGVHRLLTDLYRDMNTDGTDLDLRLLEERLKALLDTQFREGLFYSREEDVMKRLVREHLLRSLRYDVRRFEEGYRICPEYMESPLTAELAGGRYELSGRIDRVDRSPAGGYLLIDYKTGSIPSRKKHLEAADFREVQLGFYGVLLRHTEPRAPIEALCYFDLSDTHRLKRIVEGDEVYPYLDGFEQHLVAFLDRFNSSEQLSLTQDSDNCRRCCFHTVCRIYEP
jgi:RecB family exonuclease